MNRVFKSAALMMGLAIALPAAAQVGYGYDDPLPANARYDFARVIKVDAIVNRATKPVSKETCWQQPTTESYRPSYTYYRDDDSASGPDIVTVDAGIRKVSSSREECRTETDWQSTARVLGYDVTYRYGGRTYQTHMDHDPGDNLRVRVNLDYSITPYE